MTAAALPRRAARSRRSAMPPIVLPLGRAVGGSTLSTRPPASARRRGARDVGASASGSSELDAAELEPYFRRVERELNVVQTPARARRPQRAVVKRGADGSATRATSSTATCAAASARASATSAARRRPSSTSASPTCRKAWEAGATTYTGTRAQRHRARRRPRARRRGRAPAPAASCGSRATRVVVAAGTMHTPLLLRAQRARRHVRPARPQPLASTRRPACARFRRARSTWAGVPQSYYIDEFANEGIMLEGAAGPPDYARHLAAVLRRAPPRVDGLASATCRSSG